ncbi:MAG: MarR family transcriptional regulator [Pseudomonadota bacterium]
MEKMQSNIIAPEDEAGFVDGYLLYIMAQASAAVSQAFHAQLAEMGVSVATWRILASLYPDGALNVGELASRCLTKQPTLTRQLDRLCAEGWVSRENASDDRRGVIVKLTPEGFKRVSHYVRLAKDHEAKVLADYSDAEVSTLKAMLKDLQQRAKAMPSS